MGELGRTSTNKFYSIREQKISTANVTLHYMPVYPAFKILLKICSTQ